MEIKETEKEVQDIPYKTIENNITYISEVSQLKESIEEKKKEIIEEPAKTTRVKDDEVLIEEKALDSLFDKEGLGDKDTSEEKINQKPDKKIKESDSLLRSKKDNGAEKKETEFSSKSSFGPTIDSKQEIVANNKKSGSYNLSKNEFTQIIEETTHHKMIIITNENIEPKDPIKDQDIVQTLKETKPSKEEKSTIAEINHITPKETKERGKHTPSDFKNSVSQLELIGDLKLEIRIEEGKKDNIKVSLFLKDFPIKRRNRPLKKSEIKPIKIEPLIIQRADDKILMIVNHLKEGIYDILIEPTNPVSLSVTIKFYEKSPNEKIKNLGIIKIEKKTTIAKILSPEGILWEDESYFDGYIEDSESVTKFNNSSGLIWREYKEEE
jgi:hypothetical protein